MWYMSTRVRPSTSMCMGSSSHIGARGWYSMSHSIPVSLGPSSTRQRLNGSMQVHRSGPAASSS